jgi:hypothetical protein
MTIQLNGKPSMAGHFHIRQPVDASKVVAAVQELAEMQADDLSRLKDLHVRGGGDDGSYIIAFHYLMRDGSKAEADGITELVREFIAQKLKLKPKQMDWTIGTVLATI